MSSIPQFENLTVGAAQRACVEPLKVAGIDAPVMEARLLVGFVLDGGPERVLADRDEVLTDQQAATLKAALAQRCRRVPMAQIIGVREFWSLPFKVTSATLSPRPDTETLIEAILDHAAAPARVLDLGTGTGCILLALLSEWPRATGVGVDASEEALLVAQENARALDMETRARFVCADWNESQWMDALDGPFDVVVSNPPYIPASDIETLEADVRDFEPRRALDGGEDGLDAYRTIIAQLNVLLSDGGVAGFEVGIGQAEQVAALMGAAGFEFLESRTDLGGVARAVIARKV
ncbi:peptide chain release factor N(5)-glutamine methyltransferase [Magnetovibrio sp.]|uniref:peptide chain release factor N(5)-glutamine methyltransferase n=1 Tax=Magnetovibrio sp. TaxID=2024836 RepID=UPI002F9464F3